MENEIAIVAQSMKDAERLPEEELRTLWNLKINLQHEVLPQHQIETRAGSRPPTHDEIRRFEEIIPIKRGSYNPHEDSRIVKNWKRFCKIHGWSSKKVGPFLRLRDTPEKTFIRSKKERRKFVQFLARGLPNRTLYSVYHRFKNLFEVHLQRRYDPEEDTMILDHIDNNPNLDEKRKYADLAKVLKRTRSSIWRRYKLLKKKQAEHEG